ncbi:hypothetical protein [Ekhidna sp.]|uniref:hypothetical protein n=1 Tax=Ekhidna sp. TaxID=2608089 RepID=UPI003C7AD817
MRHLFTLIFTIASVWSFAQIKDGAKVIDLSFSYSDFNSNGSSSFSFVQPLVGFSITENQVFYGGFRYERQKQNFSNTSSKENIVSLVLAYEKLFELNSKIYFAPIISGSFGFGKGNDPAGDSDISSFRIGISPRLHYFITNKWSVVASVGAISYSKEVQKSDNGDFATESFGASLNASNVNFGIRMILNNE